MNNLNVIVGPPCAGKSTYVQSLKAIGDVIVDTDAIAQAIGSSPHGRAEPFRGLSLRLRHSLIERVLDGVEAHTWIIHTTPSRPLLERYQGAGSKFHLIDPGMDVCLERAATDARPQGTDDAIRQWYASPPDLSNMDVVKHGRVVFLTPTIQYERLNR